MKVFKLTYGDYDSFRMIGLYATEELAKAQVLHDVFDGESVDHPNIEEVEIIEREEDIR